MNCTDSEWWMQIAEFPAWWIDTGFVNWFKGMRPWYGSWQTIVSEVETLPKFPPFKSGRWPTTIQVKSVSHQFSVYKCIQFLSIMLLPFGHRFWEHPNLLGDFRCPLARRPAGPRQGDEGDVARTLRTVDFQKMQSHLRLKSWSWNVHRFTMIYMR